MEKLRWWIKNPQELLERTTDVFGEQLDLSNNVVSSICMFEADNLALQQQGLSVALTAAATVFERQFEPFLEGKYSVPTPDMTERSVNDCSN